MNTLKKLLSLVGLWLAVSVAAHAGTVTYIYTDNQGTPLAEADAQGNVSATFDYRPYGAQALGCASGGARSGPTRDRPKPKNMLMPITTQIGVRDWRSREAALPFEHLLSDRSNSETPKKVARR